MHPLSNFNVLKSNLKRLNRLVSVLKFEYNGITCYMVFHVLDKPIDLIWTIRLTFHNPQDKTYDFECYANQQRMSFEFYQFANFFHIAKGDGTHKVQLVQNFYSYLNDTMDTNVPEYYSDTARNYMRPCVLKDSDKRRYLYDVKRNNGRRSGENNDKAMILYPEIYHEFRNQSGLSFFFSEHEEDECTLIQILEKIRRRPI